MGDIQYLVSRQVMKELGHFQLPGIVYRSLETVYNKLTFNSLATALVDIPAVSMPIARSLETLDICSIVLCDKIAHFKLAFYCPQHKV